MNTSDRIRQLRDQRGWTQNELAEASKVDIRTIQRLESGQPVSSHTLKQVAGSLGVSLEALRLENQPTPNPSGEFLLRIARADELVAIIDGTYALAPQYGTPNNEQEADLIAGFLGSVQDYVDILDELEASQRVYAVFSLQQELDALEKGGLWVFGSRITQRIHLATASGDEVLNWPVAAIKIVPKTSSEIMQVRGDDKVFSQTNDLSV